jgi:chromatin assembly factor 1 subunit A
LTLVTSIPDYQRYFQPFHVRQDVIIAPINQFIRDPTALEVSATLIDSVLSQPDLNLPLTGTPIIKRAYILVNERLNTLLPVCTSHRSRPRGRVHPFTAKELISLLNEHPSTLDQYISVNYFPCKHLQYAEDVRPAYNGTFTRRTKLTPRNPFKRDPEIFAYEYDSEAEWEFEPEDGENLDDESVGDEEEKGSVMSDSGDEDDRAFLDDEEDDVERTGKNSKGKAVGKRFVAPLVPMIKGVNWETGGVQKDGVLAGMRATILLCDEKGDGVEGPIDPFSSEYWVVEMPPPPAPKIDLQMLLKKGDTPGTIELVKGLAKTKALFPGNLLGDFLKAIQGTTHNQTLLVELLKKQYSKFMVWTNKDFLLLRREVLRKN